MLNGTSVRQLCHHSRKVSSNVHNCAVCGLRLRFEGYAGKWPPAAYAIDPDECRNGGYKIWDSLNVWGGAAVFARISIVTHAQETTAASVHRTSTVATAVTFSAKMAVCRCMAMTVAATPTVTVHPASMANTASLVRLICTFECCAN